MKEEGFRKKCSNCDYSQLSIDEYPCSPCDNQDKWKGFAPPGKNDILEMRIEHLEMEVIGLRDKLLDAVERLNFHMEHSAPGEDPQIHLKRR
jgi:hypothetical protein